MKSVRVKGQLPASHVRLGVCVCVCGDYLKEAMEEMRGEFKRGCLSSLNSLHSQHAGEPRVRKWGWGC